MERSDFIIAWLKERQAINISALARLVNFDNTSLRKALIGERKIPDNRIHDFEKVLKDYGYEAPK